MPHQVMVTTVTGTVSETEETGRLTAKDPKHEDFGAVMSGNAYILGVGDEVADMPYRQAVNARDLHHRQNA